jgi:hypothetical protein
MSRESLHFYSTQNVCGSELISLYEWFSFAHLMQHFFKKKKKKEKVTFSYCTSRRLNSSWFDEKKIVLMNVKSIHDAQ